MKWVFLKKRDLSLRPSKNEVAIREMAIEKPITRLDNTLKSKLNPVKSCFK